MNSDPADASLDRHRRVKESHRRAIADAAVALAVEFGPGGFTSEQLAAKADVARRTVFNHYSSIGAAIYAGMGRILEGAIESVITEFDSALIHSQTGSDGVDLTAAFDDLCQALLRGDLVSPMSRIVSTIPTREPNSPDTDLWAGGTLRSLIPRLTTVTATRVPGSGVASRTLLVHSVLAALTVTVEQWYLETGGIDNDESRAVWTTTLASHLDRLRIGFGSPAP